MRVMAFALVYIHSCMSYMMPYMGRGLVVRVHFHYHYNYTTTTHFHFHRIPTQLRSSRLLDAPLACHKRSRY